jgi:hypothetical protein
MRQLVFTALLGSLFSGIATGRVQPVAQTTANNDIGQQLSMAVIRSQCIEFSEVKRGERPGDYRDCQLSEFGQFGTVDGDIYFYALYCLIRNDDTNKGKCGDDSFNGRYYRHRGLAIFTRGSTAEYARLLFERASNDIGVLFYQKPQIIQSGAGVLLYLPIALDGTGNGDESEYYLRESGRWEPIEAMEWLEDLQHRIPAGLRTRKGIWPDLNTMQAEAGLYRDGDANCCPSGGTVVIRLSIQARRFVIDSMVIENTR